MTRISTRPMSWGFTLVELIFFIVIIGIIGAVMGPVFGRAFSSLHIIGDGVRGHYLAQERLEEMCAGMRETDSEDWFPGIRDESETITLDGSRLVRIVQVQGADLNGDDLACTGLSYSGEPFKCVTVTVKHADTGEFLGDGRMVLAQ